MSTRFRMPGIVGMLMLLAVALLPISATAHDAYDDSESNPLRLVAYVVHPVGVAIEWLVMRPIHFLVSQPQIEPIFGHTAHETPFVTEHEPYQPEP